jgi:transcriptional regulator with XRE-family HTH domain
MPARRLENFIAERYCQPMLQDFVAGEVKAELGRQHQTQRDLARALGWTEIKLSRRLRGTVPWTLDEVEQVASVLDVPRSQLLDPPLQHRRATAS